jgi:hypothetical protein
MDTHTPWRGAASTSGSPTSSRHSSAGATPHPERPGPRSGAANSRSSSRHGSLSAPAVRSPRSARSDGSRGGGIRSHRGSPAHSRSTTPRGASPSPLARSPGNSSPFSPAETLLRHDSAAAAGGGWQEADCRACEGDLDSEAPREDSELHTEGVPALPALSAPHSHSNGSLLRGVCTPCGLQNGFPSASACMVRRCMLALCMLWWRYIAILRLGKWSFVMHSWARSPAPFGRSDSSGAVAVT